jgi:hypothetical protein
MGVPKIKNGTPVKFRVSRATKGLLLFTVDISSQHQADNYDCDKGKHNP